MLPQKKKFPALSAHKLQYKGLPTHRTNLSTDAQQLSSFLAVITSIHHH